MALEIKCTSNDLSMLISPSIKATYNNETHCFKMSIINKHALDLEGDLELLELMDFIRFDTFYVGNSVACCLISEQNICFIIDSRNSLKLIADLVFSQNNNYSLEFSYNGDKYLYCSRGILGKNSYIIEQGVSNVKAEISSNSYVQTKDFNLFFNSTKKIQFLNVVEINLKSLVKSDFSVETQICGRITLPLS